MFANPLGGLFFLTHLKFSPVCRCLGRRKAAAHRRLLSPASETIEYGPHSGSQMLRKEPLSLSRRRRKIPHLPHKRGPKQIRNDTNDSCVEKCSNMGTGSSYVARRRYRMGRYALQFLGVVALVALLRSQEGAQPTYDDKGRVAKILDQLPRLSSGTDSMGRRASLDSSSFSLSSMFGSPFRSIEQDKHAIEQRVEFQKLDAPSGNQNISFNDGTSPGSAQQPNMGDARLAGLEARTDNAASNIVIPSSKKTLLIDRKKATEAVPADGGAEENVLVVIISNRRDGIIPTIASILTTSSKKVDVVLIGEHKINEQVGAHFGDRINDFTSLSVQDITDDLVLQGYNPIWTWPEWHSSVNNPSWRNENTIHIGSWDNLKTHAHELNHLRFYLAHVSIFRGKRYFYFLDDDILIQKDLGVLAERTMNDLDASRGLVCACNIWMWNSECFHFEFQSKKDYILSMPSLYGDREVCKTDSEDHCVPSNYWDFVNANMPKGGKDQHAWNFGFALFALNNWRDLELTPKYEKVMRESYRLHVFPETSLTFGLGVSYIAFAGAVECWNEEYVQVRDGFGFIEWDRYQKTFGKDFFDSVDVVHYTGPDKPWVEDSRIEERAITPWLKMMEHEKMPIPKQLPLEPTDNLFILLASDRTGAQWIMSLLDSHPGICASGEGDKPETGFPADVLLPDGLPWYPHCSIKRGCTFEFMKTTVTELMKDMGENNIPRRCQSDYDTSTDPLAEHLGREDRSLVGCGCVRGVKAKGLKVLMEWMKPKGFPFEEMEPAFVDLSSSRAHGSKVIRLKRRNIWARYKSKILAKQTNVYHPTNSGQKQAQLDSAQETTISAEHMEWHMKQMEALDDAADEWARTHGSEVLTVDYEDCRADTPQCFRDIFDFLGVDPSFVEGKKADTFRSTFAGFADVEHTMEHVSNKEQVLELLGINNWHRHAPKEHYRPIHFLAYEPSEILVDSRKHVGVSAKIFGQGSDGTTSWLSSALPSLREVDPDALVVLASDRDSRISFPAGKHESLSRFLAKFKTSFHEITKGKDGAIVLSTSTYCCPSALTHSVLGDYFSESGGRTNRACLSGTPGCEWAGEDKAAQWKSFMNDLAQKREAQVGNVYLDTSLIAGHAKDLIPWIEALDVGPTEDTRAVVADFLYRNSDSIFLDYNEELFGQSRRPAGTANYNPCSMQIEATTAAQRIDHEDIEARPMFIYMPESLGCGDDEKDVAPKYPVWGDPGIVMAPMLEHIGRVADEKETIVLPPYYGRKVDYHQGPEVPYVFNEQGIWTSRLIRDRTNNATMFWRVNPTEAMAKEAYEILTDERSNPNQWPVLREAIKGEGFPIFSWYGDYKSCNHKNYDEASIPILTTDATSGCTHAFPIPNYMTIIDTQTSEENWLGVFQEFERDYPWDAKIRKVVWRGALSEAEWRNALTSVRWRVAKLVQTSDKKDLFDIGLTGIPDWITEHLTFDMSLVGGFKEGLSPMKSFQKYLAVLDMDGNAWSSRFGTLLCYNSVVIKVEPKYFEYFFADLKPWTHYIPVKNDLTDLEANVAWALDPANEQAIKSIIGAANRWCSHRLVPEELKIDFLDVLESYTRLLQQGNPEWKKEFQDWLSDATLQSKLEMVKI